MRYVAVIFDMGDVFYDATRFRRALTEFLRSQGIMVDYAGLCRLWETQLIDVYLARRHYWDAFRDLLRHLGIGPDAVPQATAFAINLAQACAQDQVLFDGVADTMAALKTRGLKLAVLSDTESSGVKVRRRLEEFQISCYIDAVVTSVDIGHVKPEPEAYAAALACLVTSPGRTIFVGHDEEELFGAMRAGLTAVAFNAPERVLSHARIGPFRELLDLV